MPHSFLPRLLAVVVLAAAALTHAAEPAAPPAASEPATRAAAAPAGEKRVALVIGNAEYKQGPLGNPVNDARAMAGRLRGLGFDVVLRENLKTREIGGAYREFRSKIVPGGTALVFYAGHGIQFKGENYFPAVDADIASEEDVPLQSINLNTLLGNMEEAKAGVSLVFLDACRDNPFARRFRSASRGLAKVEAASGTLIHYATRPGSVASDGEGQNGTYTEALLAHMGEAGVPVEQVLKRVTNRVVSKTKGKQEPWVEGSLRGEFYFIFTGPTTVQVQAAADPESEAWRTAQEVGSVSAYEMFLGTYPKGKYATSAKIKLADLKKAEREKGRPTANVPVAASDPESQFWNEVKASGAKEYYEAYVKQYPKGKYQALAKLEIKKLEEKDKAEQAQAEQEAWEQAKAGDTPAGYGAYMDAYPSGRYILLAQAGKERAQKEAVQRQKAETERKEREAQEADQRAWAQAEKSNTEESYLKYQRENPHGRYLTQATERQKTLQQDAALKAETELWRKAEGAKDSATVQGFLDRYPSGRYVTEAQTRLAALKKEEAELRPGKVFKDCTDCPEMVVVPAGSFEMGSNSGDGDEKPVHTVRIAKPFALAKTEVTQGQWRAIMGSNPSHFSNCGDDCPVEKVNWNEAQEYVRKLSQKTGKTYRLPSEAEWEYACRAGGTHTYCGSESIDGVAWYGSNSSSKTHAVAGKQANAWGLYDMSGNVWEWTEDCWNDSYSGAPSDGSAWTNGQCDRRVLRGGSWSNTPQYARSAIRNRLGSTGRLVNFGFRPARMLP